MGDSGVSCAFTGVSMNYDSVALIALAPKRFLEPRRHPVSYALGSQSNEPFSAMFLPIFGSLDGYGGLRDIERDRNVLFLEKKLGLRIEVSYTAKPPESFLGTLPEMGWTPRRTPTYPRQGGEEVRPKTDGPNDPNIQYRSLNTGKHVYSHRSS